MKRLPAVVKLVARVMPVVRELDETSHQFERPFVVDDSAARTTFDLAPTAWETALAATVDSLLGRGQVPAQL